MLFSCILRYTFLIYQMLWSPVKREFCTPYSMFLEVHQYWKLKLHVFHTNMFICTVCTGINFLHFVVDVGLCMKIKGFQSLMKIVYTLNSTIICNIMILHSWVNGWSCITWYNVYVARVYRISNICSCSLVNSCCYICTCILKGCSCLHILYSLLNTEFL